MKKYLSMVTILSLSLLNAGEFHSVGGTSISMGGAGVASASGSLAGYYNPALLTQTKGVEVSLGLGAGVREANLGEHINTLSDLKLTDTVDRIANNAPTSSTNSVTDRNNIVTAKKALNDIGNENGISLMPTAYLGVQYDNMAIGVYMTSDIVISANIDPTHTELSVKDNNNNYYNYNPTTDTYGAISQGEYERSSLQYALDNKLTTIDATGLALTEIPISYAKAFELSKGELSVGTSVKLMHGTTYTQSLAIDNKAATDENSLKENQRDTNTVGVDIGLLFKPSSLSKLQIGLVGKNLNTPTFDTANGSTIKVEPQVRTGVQYSVSNDLELAADLDLTTNKTLINGYDSQMFGGGVNYHPLSWFALRGGAMQNLANSNEGLVYTAGLTVGHEKLSLDISAQMSSNTGSYDGQDIPKYAQVNVALISKW